MAKTQRLDEIKDELLELIEEAEKIVRDLDISPDRMIYHRAYAYWIPQMTMAVTNDHDWLGSCSVCLEETIEDLDKLDKFEKSKKSKKQST